MNFKRNYKAQAVDQIVDVADESHWTFEQEYDGIFQKGAREKSALFCCETAYDFLIKPEENRQQRYLYKLSRRSYQEQFWVEIIAYRLGCLMGVPVPGGIPGSGGFRVGPK